MLFPKPQHDFPIITYWKKVKLSREMMDIMLSDRFMCDCEMVWRSTDEQVAERLAGKR